MDIAEFYVSLGVKGSEKSVGAITAVTDGMSNLWNSSTAAKVAIVGAFYELEQLFSASNKTGTELAQFSTLTGLSTQKVQEYNAAIQLATGNQRDLNTTISTFTDLQKSVRNIQFGDGNIVGKLSQMFGLIGRDAMSPDELKKWAPNIDMLIQRMREFAVKAQALKVAPDVIARTIFGITEDHDLVASIMNGGLAPDKLAATMPVILSDGYINSIKLGAEAWAKMHLEMDKAMGTFNAKEGAKLAKDLTPLIDQVLKLTIALTNLADKVKVFDLMGKSIQGLTMLLGGDIDYKMDKDDPAMISHNRYLAAEAWAKKMINDPKAGSLVSTSGGRAMEYHRLVQYYITNHISTTLQGSGHADDQHKLADANNKHAKAAFGHHATSRAN